MTIGNFHGEYLSSFPIHELPVTNEVSSRSTINIQGLRCEVDLGADEGRPGRKNNQFVLEIKQTCKVRMEALKGYLEKRVGWDNSTLECMSEWQNGLRVLAAIADIGQASLIMPFARAPRSACV
jgi:hypothetical protein